MTLIMKQGRIHNTISHGGWAGAVMCWVGAVGSAVLTTTSVACHGTPEPSVGQKKLPSVMTYIIVFVKKF